MLIEFEVRPQDRRRLGAWRVSKLPFRRWHFTALGVLTWFGANALALRYPHALGLDTDWNLILMFPIGMAVVCGVVLLVARAVARRHKNVANFADGRHSLHFSQFGIHHVGPNATHRYPWQHFKSYEIRGFRPRMGILVAADASSSYVLLRFQPDGTLAIPFTALAGLGPEPLKTFFQTMGSLMAAGRRST